MHFGVVESLATSDRSRCIRLSGPNTATDWRCRLQSKYFTVILGQNFNLTSRRVPLRREPDSRQQQGIVSYVRMSSIGLTLQ